MMVPCNLSGDALQKYRMLMLGLVRVAECVFSGAIVTAELSSIPGGHIFVRLRHENIATLVTWTASVRISELWKSSDSRARHSLRDMEDMRKEYEAMARLMLDLGNSFTI